MSRQDSLAVCDPEGELPVGQVTRVGVRLVGDTFTVSINGQQQCSTGGFFDNRVPPQSNVDVWLGDPWYPRSRCDRRQPRVHSSVHMWPSRLIRRGVEWVPPCMWRHSETELDTSSVSQLRSSAQCNTTSIAWCHLACLISRQSKAPSTRSMWKPWHHVRQFRKVGVQDKEQHGITCRVNFWSKNEMRCRAHQKTQGECPARGMAKGQERSRRESHQGPARRALKIQMSSHLKNIDGSCTVHNT